MVHHYERDDRVFGSRRRRRRPATAASDGVLVVVVADAERAITTILSFVQKV